MNLAFGLIQTLLAASLLVYAFRAHERFWTLGFLGWRKVYTGLVLALLGGLASLAAHWADSGGTVLPLSSALAGGLGLALVLAGSIERLHDLARERRQLEDVRAGYDLFDTLREVAGGAYAFLEVLDFALREMVRASGAAAGGLWLYNPAGKEWVLTGAAGMSQSFRKQTESVRGSGTGFDRLARTSKARVFSRVEEIRLFFPEWEAEGYRSVLGLPLLTGAAGSPGALEKHLLGVIVLADQTESRFDDDRARRLHAAADYVAAVVAEARLQRQLEAAQKRNESQTAEAETRLQDAERRRASLSEEFAVERAEGEQRTKRLIEDHENQLAVLKTESATAAEHLRAEYDERLAAAVHRHEELHAQWQEVHQAEQQLRESLDAERREWARRSEEWQRQEIARREEWEQQRVAREAQIDQLRGELAGRDDELSRRSHAHEEQMQGLRAQAEELHRAAADEQRRLREELQSLHAALADRERQVIAERDAERHQAREDHDRLTAELQSLRATLADRERQMMVERDAERRQTREDHDRLTAELQSFHAEVAQREQAMNAEREHERRCSAEQIAERDRQAAELEMEMAALRAQLGERHDEITVLRAEIEARRRDLVEAHEAAERRLADIGNAHAAQLQAEHETAQQKAAEFASERDDAAATITRLEELIGSLRQENDRTLAHWHGEMETQRRQSRQRLDETAEKLHRIEAVLADLLTVLTASNPLGALMTRIHEQLPPDSELWLWRRLPDATADLLSVCRGSDRLSGNEVGVRSPWRFEAETIPAEGVTVVHDAGDWTAREEYEDQYHRERWDEVWGRGRRPSWAVCWPWAASAGAAGENGWLTAFGFGTEQPPPPQAIDLLAVHAGAMGALIVGAERRTEAETTEACFDADDHEESPAAVLESRSRESCDSDTNLHAAVIAWVADQKEDEWRLDLAAPVPPPVNGRWLAGVLDSARASCRNGGDAPNQFAIETRLADGRAQLRLANQSLADASGDLLSRETGSDDSTPAVADSPGDATCHWLTSGGHRVGVEITFPHTEPADRYYSGAPLDILVADDQPAMAELLAGMLQTLGHHAVTSAGAQEAYSRFVAEHFDLVIVSGGMPQDTGLALAGWIKSHNPTTPVILVTEPGVGSMRGHDAPSWDWTLEKPFHLDQLQECLTALREKATVSPPVDTVGEMMR